MEQNKDTWSKILHIIITIITALATALTTQSCIKANKSKYAAAQVTQTSLMSALAAEELQEPIIFEAFDFSGVEAPSADAVQQLINVERPTKYLVLRAATDKTQSAAAKNYKRARDSLKKE